MLHSCRALGSAAAPDGFRTCTAFSGAAKRRRTAPSPDAPAREGGDGGGDGGGQDVALRTFEGVFAEDALALFSAAGGKGGDDPDEDLKELPLARWAAAKGARSLARFLGHPLVSSLAMLVALLAALLYSRH